MKYSATIFSFLVISISSFAQTRMDQLSNLKVWIRMDSMKVADCSGVPCADGIAVDSIKNLGSLASEFFANAAGTIPTYKPAISPNGLPGLNMDGNDDRIIFQGTKANYKFLHDGTSSYTIVIVFQLKSIGQAQFLLMDNSNTSDPGFMISLNGLNQVVHLISKDTGTHPINNPTSNTFGNADSVQIISVTYNTAGSDTSRIRVNNQMQTFSIAASTYSSNDSQTNLLVGADASDIPNACDAYIYEIGIYSDLKTEVELSNLYDGLIEHWVGSASEPPSRRRGIIINN